MNKKLSEKTVMGIREAVSKGEPRYKVAERFGIHPSNVYYYTKDFPKRSQKKRTIVSVKMNRKIRISVKRGVPRCEVAKEMGLSIGPICRRTKDLPQRRGKFIGGWSLNVLETITKEGYLIPNSSDIQRARRAYRTLKKYIPINSVQAEGRTVYYLEGRNKEALNAFLETRKKRVVDYQRICKIMVIFGIHKNQYKEALIGKFSLENIKKKRRILKKLRHPDSVSDYFGRFLHSELL